MSTRPTQDWSPLGLSWDPIPGDPEEVTATATSYANTENSVDTAAQNLRRLNSTETRSDAVAKIVQNSMSLATQLEEVRDRYQQASGALAAYAPVLAQAQADSLAALSEASVAAGQARNYQSAVLSNYQAAKHAVTPDQQTQAAIAMNQAANRRNAALQNVAAAKAKLQQAIANRDAAAMSATAKIEGSIQGSPLNDSVWDKFKNLIKPALDVVEKTAKWVWNHMDKIALVMTALAVLFSWVPGFDVVLAGLAAAARALATIQTGLQVAKDVVVGLKTGRWTPLLVDGGVLALSFIGGKAAGKALENLGERGAGRALSQASKEKFTALKSKLSSVVTDLRGEGKSVKRGIDARELHRGVDTPKVPSTIDRLMAGESISDVLHRQAPKIGTDGRFEAPPRDPLLSVGVPNGLQGIPLVPRRIPILQPPLRPPNLPELVHESVSDEIQHLLKPYADAYRHRIESQVCDAR